MKRRAKYFNRFLDCAPLLSCPPPRYAGKFKELKAEPHRLMAETGALPDKMPLYEGIKIELPDEDIR